MEGVEDGSTALDSHDAAMVDAAMMEQSMDDLFGEAADSLTVDALGVSLPSPPLPPALVLRMTEKQHRGCCTKLAYANTGSIAQITGGGKIILFRSIMRDGKAGSWRMTVPSETPIYAPDGHVFQHIQFSDSGVDLAAIDNYGYVYCYSCLGSIGLMLLAPSNTTRNGSGQSEFDAVVGLHWLSARMDLKTPYITPASKLSGQWSAEMRYRNPHERMVHHPDDNRHALLYVSRDAKLTLMYQNESAWNSIMVELDAPNSISDYFSHAAITDNGGHILLIAYDLGHRFRLYKISLDWHATQHARPGGLPYHTVAPSMEVIRVTMLENIAAQHANLAVLSHLSILPAISPNFSNTDMNSTPTIFAIFTRATLPLGLAAQHDEAFSVIARWQIQDIQPSLHESFLKLKPNSRPPAQPLTMVLRREEDIITSKIILACRPQDHHMALAFVASDGTIDFRDRQSMTMLEPFGDATTVPGLQQAGFEQAGDQHHTHVAMSPDGSLLVLANDDKEVTYKSMALRYGWQPLEDDISDTGGLVEAAFICLAREYAILSYSLSNTSTDEILALFPPQLGSDQRVLFVQAIARLTNRTFDIALGEPGRLPHLVSRELLIRPMLSAQYILAMGGEDAEPALAFKFSYAFLNLRLVWVAAFSVIPRGGPDAATVAIGLHSARGIYMWILDFFAYVVDSLAALKRAVKVKTEDKSTVQAFLEAAIERQCPVLNILYCGFTRFFLRFLAQTTAQALQVIGKSLPHARTLTQRQELENVVLYAGGLPFTLLSLNAFLGELDGTIRKAFSTLPAARRTEIELQIMTRPTIPDELIPAVQYLVETALPKFLENADQAALYFRDTSWLGIEPVSTTEDEKGRPEFDAIRKLPMPKGTKARVCKRCGATMEDFAPERLREMPSWVQREGRHCFCGGYWITKPVKSEDDSAKQERERVEE